MSIFGAFNPYPDNSVSRSQAQQDQSLAVDREARGWRNAMARQAAEYERALALEQAENAGLKEQMRCALLELERLDPNNILLQPSGKMLKNGKPEKNIVALWRAAFDKFISKRLPGNPAQYRDI